MAANNLGTAYIKIAPQMQGIQKSISDGLAGIKSTSLPGAAALGTVIAKGVSAAMNLVTSSLDKAIERTDIINNFPKVMSNMGISADKAKDSIDKLKDKLDGLPTSLQDGASAVQRFTSKNADIEKSTELFLALNNAILAGGAPAELQATAIEQMSQAYAKGKPDMMEWRAIQSAMPAQLRQIAIEMGYGADGVADLGEALRKGDASMDDFMNTIVKLNTTGANGFQSFEQQARNSTDGIGTALTNVQNRAAAAIQKVIQSFGSKDLSDAINKFSSSFSGIAEWIANNIVPIVKNQLIPALKNVLSVVKGVIEFIAQNKWVQDFLIGILNTLIAFKAVSTVKDAVSGIIAPIAKMAGNLGGAVSAFKNAYSAGLSFSASLGSAASASTGAVSAFSSLGSGLSELASTLGVGGVAGIAGFAATSILGLRAGLTGLERDENIARTAAREYARAHYDVKQMADDAAQSLRLQQQATEDLKSAQQAATDAEYKAILAEEKVAAAQDKLDLLRKNGKTDTNEYRLAEIELKKAWQESKIASDDLRMAQNEVNKAKEDAENATIAEITQTNKLVGEKLKEAGSYGTLAQQLDMLRGKTLQYRDAHGNLVETTAEKTNNMIDQVAEDLARGDEAWRKVVDTANTQGISYIEACQRVGMEAGDKFIGSFAVTANEEMYMVTEVGQGAEKQLASFVDPTASVGKNTGNEYIMNLVNGIASKYGITSEAGRQSIMKAVSAAASGTRNAEEIGRQLTNGTGLGILDARAIGQLIYRATAMIRRAINAMKAEAGINSPSKETAKLGMFMSTGLAKGIDDYADVAVEAAESMTERAIAAMDSDLGTFDVNGGGYATAVGGAAVTQYNNFNVTEDMDVKEVSRSLGWQVATAV